MKQIPILIATIILFSLIGCNSKNENIAEQDSGSYYTCPMHPTVNSKSPGSCPVCNMSLIKVEKANNNNPTQEGNYVTLDKRQQQLAGINTDKAKYQIITPTLPILGTVTIDQKQVTTIGSRVKGRIDKLNFKTSGHYVKKGDPIYAIYSEQLLADSKEFLVLLEEKNKGNTENILLNNLLSASKNKLLLWGLSEKQINQLMSNNLASSQITFYAEAEGYVTDILVKEGEYVEAGTLLMRLASLKQVWIDAQVYANEVDQISRRNSFMVFSVSNPEKIKTARLVYNNPGVEDGRKVQLLRLSVDNRQGDLIPGMMVYVSPELKSTKPTLAVPKSAVILEKMKTVWVLAHDNTFEQRMVKTGAENKLWVEILSGLKENETVVTDGAYLINSEFILKSGTGQSHDH